MRVIGVDPAPGSGGHVFDGRYRRVTTTQLSEELNTAAELGDALVCWDAPLSGPADPDQVSARPGELTKRPIEEFFTQARWGFRVPSGISVLGYGACSHWTISRQLIGLPRVGQWDSAWSLLPFCLLTGEPPRAPGCYIVEVHPALALWLWCGFGQSPWSGPWNYKEDDSVFLKLWNRLVAIISVLAPPLHGILVASGVPNSDDDLDARIAWLLGELWLQNRGIVSNLGSLALGTFLVPTSPELAASFSKFVESRKRTPCDA